MQVIRQHHPCNDLERITLLHPPHRFTQQIGQAHQQNPLAFPQCHREEKRPAQQKFAPIIRHTLPLLEKQSAFPGRFDIRRTSPQAKPHPESPPRIKKMHRNTDSKNSVVSVGRIRSKATIRQKAPQRKTDDDIVPRRWPESWRIASRIRRTH